MRKKTILAAAILTIMSGAILCGCGAGSGVNDQSAAQQTEEAQTEEAGQGEEAQAEEIQTEEIQAEEVSSESQQEKQSDDEKQDAEDADQEDEVEVEATADSENLDAQADGDDEYRDFEEPFGEEIQVDGAIRRKMNIFLSNFSEAGLNAYDKDNRDLKDILGWAHIWTKINKWDNIEYEEVSGEGTCEKISFENINKMLDKYLGFTISDDEAAQLNLPDDNNRFFCKDGNLYSPAADGEAYTRLSIISGVEDLGENKLKLYFTIYAQDLDVYMEWKEKDEYYGLSADEASVNKELEQQEVGYAVVVSDGGSYKLEHLEIK
ncbi:MAG: hypothetical protein K6E75_03720 [Lachnospiraceae bacterium]|nr:hypothetical protein [Lachnospiraceae bacterium]